MRINESKVVITVLLSFCLFLTKCKKDDYYNDPKPTPVITAFTPTAGPKNTVVIITGNNFDTDLLHNGVMFNTTQATVLSASATQIVTSVPAEATTGKIKIYVKGVSITSETDFTVTVTPPPSNITSFSPESGFPETQVTIIGTKFKEGITANTVKFNGKDAVVLSATTTLIITRVPADATTGKITVTTDGVINTSATDFTVFIPPTIESFTPTSGVITTPVTITGTNFSTTLTGNTVLFNGVEGTVTAATPTSITVTVPQNATTGRISVTVNERDAISASDFTVL
jgi:hypothetical protein